MTKVTFSSQGGRFLSVDILGHAGYAEEGEDIVCAAISSAVMLTTVLLDDIQHVPVESTADEDNTHIHIELQQGGMERGQDALSALHLYLSVLEQNYPEFLSVMEVHTDAED